MSTVDERREIPVAEIFGSSGDTTDIDDLGYEFERKELGGGTVQYVDGDLAFKLVPDGSEWFLFFETHFQGQVLLGAETESDALELALNELEDFADEVDTFASIVRQWNSERGEG